MKFFAGFLVALAVTIVWQTSVISGEKTNPAVQQAIDAVQQESQAADREPFEPGDCD
jgi:23S rRNA A1618 N6-methylase RlmF